jgi:hypothetical protein
VDLAWLAKKVNPERLESEVTPKGVLASARDLVENGAVTLEG